MVEKEADALAVITAWKSVYNAGLANAVASHTCNLCERPFTAPEEAAFVQKIDQKVRQLPIAEQAKTAEHRAAVDLLKTLTQARPTWEDCQRVEKEELPAAEQTAVRCVPLSVWILTERIALTPSARTCLRSQFAC